MKKLSLILASSFVFLSGPLFSVGAQGISSPVEETDIPGLINRLSGLVRPVTIVTFLGVIIYGGYTRLTATGDPEKEKKSMQILSAGVIGFLIIVFAPLLVRILGDLIGVSDIISTQ